MDEQLEAASWNLEPLVEGGGPEAVETMLNEARTRAEAFAERYRGRVAELDWRSWRRRCTSWPR